MIIRRVTGRLAPRLASGTPLLAFVALGLPAGAIGVAWPYMRLPIHAPLSGLGILIAAWTGAYHAGSSRSGDDGTLRGLRTRGWHARGQRIPGRHRVRAAGDRPAFVGPATHCHGRRPGSSPGAEPVSSGCARGPQARRFLTATTISSSWGIAQRSRASLYGTGVKAPPKRPTWLSR